MTAHIVKGPDIGEGIAEVELVEWHVKPGDTVIADQILADVMTDKATVEVPAPIAGVIAAISGKPGDKLAGGRELLGIDAEGGAAVASAAREPKTPPVVPGPPKAAHDVGAYALSQPTPGTSAPSRDGATTTSQRS